MICNVFRPKRKSENGKIRISRLYRGRYRLDNERSMTEVSLRTPDKQVAVKRLKDIIKEKQQESAGIILPRTLREAANLDLAEHLERYLSDLGARGRSEKHVRMTRTRVTTLINECGWAHNNVTAESQRLSEAGSHPCTPEW